MYENKLNPFACHVSVCLYDDHKRQNSEKLKQKLNFIEILWTVDCPYKLFFVNGLCKIYIELLVDNLIHLNIETICFLWQFWFTRKWVLMKWKNSAPFSTNVSIFCPKKMATKKPITNSLIFNSQFHTKIVLITTETLNWWQSDHLHEYCFAVLSADYYKRIRELDYTHLGSILIRFRRRFKCNSFNWNKFMKATAGRVWMKFPLSDKLVTFDSLANASVGTIYDGRVELLVLGTLIFMNFWEIFNLNCELIHLLNNYFFFSY